MPPSSTLQARIQAFESLSEATSSPRDIPENSKREDANPLDSYSPPSVSSIPPILPSPPLRPHSSSPAVSPHVLNTKTSLIDLRDWVIDDGPGAMSPLKQNGASDVETASNRSGPINGSKNHPDPIVKKSPPPRPPTGGKRVLPPHPSQTSPSLHVNDSAPLINLDSPQPQTKAKSGKAPPLPPRKQSYSSLRSVSTPTLSPITPSAAGKDKDIPSPLLKPPDADHTYPPNLSKLGLNSGRGHAPASSISSFHSVSLSSDGGNEHDRSASVTSLSILQTPIDDKDKEWTDGDSLDESFENVSASSFVPSLSITQYLQGTTASKPEPPKLPQRPPAMKPKPRLSAPASLAPSSTSSSPISLVSSPILTPTTSGSSSHTNATRRAAPPPPPPTRTSRSRPPSARTSTTSTTSTTASDRASILSYGTTTSISSLGSSFAVTPKPSASAFSGISLGSTAAMGTGTSRPTPVPPAARVRYDALFDKTLAAVRAKRREHLAPASPPSSVKGKRRQNGWRGLSVDLITGADVSTDDAESIAGSGEGDDDDRIEGQVVKMIWMRSKLSRERLRTIWMECDPKERGSLDRDAFARGMWRIDEDLRKAHLGLGRVGASIVASRKPVRRVVSKPILR